MGEGRSRIYQSDQESAENIRTEGWFDIAISPLTRMGGLS